LKYLRERPGISCQFHKQPEHKVDWFVNDETSSRKTQDGVTSSLYEFKESNSGSYTLKAVVTDPSGNYDSATKTWNVTVQSKYYSSGNRIWDEGLGYPEHIPGMPRVIRASITTLTPECLLRDDHKGYRQKYRFGNIEYITRPTETDFEYKGWGSYQIIGFMQRNTLQATMIPLQ
jgi:hypothetical protein